jgi:hypothetical protein
MPLEHSKMKALSVTMIVGMMTSAACSKPKEEPVSDSHPGMAMDSGRMDGMAGMGGPGMMALMQAHMDSMTRLNPEQTSRMMSTHQRMMSQMLDQMGGEMRQMKMSADPKWDALNDSVKQDLADLPGLSGQALAARMREHAGRIRRLMMMHERMMKGMR